jgi:two-component system, sensor histidine kinase and response regulator
LGPTLTPEQIERVGGFMQFERNKYEQQGTGLGLSIAKQLIETSGGRLKIKSVDGETHLYISLPYSGSSYG